MGWLTIEDTLPPMIKEPKKEYYISARHDKRCSRISLDQMDEDQAHLDSIAQEVIK